VKEHNQNRNITIVAIFLAAGISARMGKPNKLLLPFNKATLIQHTLTQIQHSHVNEIIIVTGYQANEVKSTLKLNTSTFAHNSNYQTGMTSSIQIGIKAASKEFDGYMLALSDMPFLTTKNYNTITNKFRKNYQQNPLIVVPQVAERLGNPVIFSKHWLSEILNHQNPEGCKNIIQKNNSFVQLISIDNKNAFNDIDKPEDYRNLINV